VTDQYPMIAACAVEGDRGPDRVGPQGAAPTIIRMTIVCAVISLALEVSKIVSKGKIPISPLAIGLGVLLPPDSSLSMWLGSMFFMVASKVFSKPGTKGNLLFVETQEPICAGLIAGWALMCIGDTGRAGLCAAAVWEVNRAAVSCAVIFSQSVGLLAHNGCVDGASAKRGGCDVTSTLSGRVDHVCDGPPGRWSAGLCSCHLVDIIVDVRTGEIAIGSADRA